MKILGVDIRTEQAFNFRTPRQHWNAPLFRKLQRIAIVAGTAAITYVLKPYMEKMLQQAAESVAPEGTSAETTESAATTLAYTAAITVGLVASHAVVLGPQVYRSHQRKKAAELQLSKEEGKWQQMRRDEISKEVSVQHGR